MQFHGMAFLTWVPAAAYMRFKTVMRPHKTKKRPAPTCLRRLSALQSLSTAGLVPPSLREQGRCASRLLSVLAPTW